MVSDEAPLLGRTVVTTREMPGDLDRRLAALGAHVVQVPMIEVVDLEVEPVNGPLDWVVVTSRHGASCLVDLLTVDNGRPSLAAVGVASARVLAEVMGRDVDLVPEHQTGEDLAAKLLTRVSPGDRALVALGDLASRTVIDSLVAAGVEVEERTVYSTRRRRPGAEQLTAASGADAVLLASGSAATAWADAGPIDAGAVVAIGPTTAEAARSAGLEVTAIAEDHSIDGLVDAVVALLSQR
jgi:uroporphyrinogen-III synthase